MVYFGRFTFDVHFLQGKPPASYQMTCQMNQMALSTKQGIVYGSAHCLRYSCFAPLLSQVGSIGSGSVKQKLALGNKQFKNI
jgi:hypothetical protein